MGDDVISLRFVVHWATRLGIQSVAWSGVSGWVH